MAILYDCENLCIVSHEMYIEQIYRNTKHLSEWANFLLNRDLFNITNPYIRDTQLHNYNDDVNSGNPKKRKKKHRDTFTDNSSVYEEVCKVKEKFLHAIEIEDVKQIFTAICKNCNENNTAARSASKSHFENLSGNSDVKHGKNDNAYPITVCIHGKTHIIPSTCQFYNCDVLNLTKILSNDMRFDFIILDPPWRNKYIRRKRRKNELDGYRMMYDSEISSIPVQRLMANNGLVAVWCTNSPNHIKALKNDIFPSWNLRYISTWFWVKVTKTGGPVCEFSRPPGKQPFERILFACDSQRSDSFKQPKDEKILVSVPSAIHSHKPPLVELIKEYLGDKPKCLELFARYLLPDWTSCGDQVLSLQNLDLYVTEKCEVFSDT